MALSSLSRKCGLNMSTILTSFKQGDTSDYDALVESLIKPDVKDKLVIDVLRKSRECISEVDKDCEYFVGALLALNWSRRDARLVLEYQAFILNLVSAHMCYLRPCLRMVVKTFVPVQRIEEDVTGDDVLADGSSFVNVHSLLKSVGQLVPMVAKVLVPLIADNYPYINKRTYVHEFYVRNVLQLCQYMPENRRDILCTLVSKLLELDARASREDIIDGLEPASDDDGRGAHEDVFNMDEEETVSVDDLQCSQPMSHVEADKLDVCLGLLLEYIHNVCFVNGELNWETTKKLYKELLTIFDTVVLRTFSCAHVQFIIFYICSFSSPLAEGFVDYLWKKVRDVNAQSLFRQCAVAYLASYLARAKYLHINTVVTTLDVMSEWIHAYIRQASHASAPNVLRHGPFYSVCQALFYAFIFRHREILEQKQGHRICLKFNFGTIATCRLNPLKVCLPMIAQTFSGVARMHQLAYCDAIIERNSRSIIPVTTLNGAAGGGDKWSRINLLDSFFPFDPYLLTRSRKYIEALYLEFRGEPIEEDDSTASEDDDDFIMDCGSSNATDSAKQALATSPSDFLMYGTSPGFKRS